MQSLATLQLSVLASYTSLVLLHNSVRTAARQITTLIIARIVSIVKITYHNFNITLCCLFYHACCCATVSEGECVA